MSRFISRNKIPLSIILAALIIGGFIYFSQNPTTQTEEQLEVSPTVTEAVVETTPAVTPTKEPQGATSTPVLPSPTPTVSDEEIIKQGLIEETGMGEAELEYGISYNDGEIARGSVKHRDEISGAAWFAGKKDGEWVIAYIGQGVPGCSEIEPFEFPNDWISHCMEGDTAVER